MTDAPKPIDTSSETVAKWTAYLREWEVPGSQPDHASADLLDALTTERDSAIAQRDQARQIVDGLQQTADDLHKQLANTLTEVHALLASRDAAIEAARRALEWFTFPGVKWGAHVGSMELVVAPDWITAARSALAALDGIGTSELDP